jgi:transposase InsO family protein
MGVSRRTVLRWRRRAPDFADRSCRPLHSPRRLSDEREAQILALRVERRWGPDRIAAVLGLRASTVHRVLRRHCAHRLSHLFPKPRRSFGRFEISTPGELVAMDTKSLGSLARGGGRHPGIGGGHSGAGWRQLHVAIDLASRVVVAQERPTCGNVDTLAFLEHALATYAAMGIRVQRLLTDNGSGYKRAFHERAAALGLRHTRTKPYHPWTNGRVERFNGTIQRECLYAERLTSNDEREIAIRRYVAYYNAERPHIALGGLSPLKWLRENGTYVSGDLS